MAFVGEEGLRAAGYTETQVRAFESGARAAGESPSFVGGVLYVGGSPTKGQALAQAAGIKGTWVGGVGGWYEVFSPGHRKTTLVEGERDLGIIPTEAISYDVKTGVIKMEKGSKQPARFTPRRSFRTLPVGVDPRVLAERRRIIEGGLPAETAVSFMDKVPEYFLIDPKKEIGWGVKATPFQRARTVFQDEGTWFSLGVALGREPRSMRDVEKAQSRLRNIKARAPSINLEDAQIFIPADVKAATASAISPKLAKRISKFPPPPEQPFYGYLSAERSTIRELTKGMGKTIKEFEKEQKSIQSKRMLGILTPVEFTKAKILKTGELLKTKYITSKEEKALEKKYKKLPDQYKTYLKDVAKMETDIERKYYGLDIGQMGAEIWGRTIETGVAITPATSMLAVSFPPPIGLVAAAGFQLTGMGFGAILGAGKTVGRRLTYQVAPTILGTTKGRELLAEFGGFAGEISAYIGAQKAVAAWAAHTPATVKIKQFSPSLKVVSGKTTISSGTFYGKGEVYHPYYGRKDFYFGERNLSQTVDALFPKGTKFTFEPPSVKSSMGLYPKSADPFAGYTGFLTKTRVPAEYRGLFPMKVTRTTKLGFRGTKIYGEGITTSFQPTSVKFGELPIVTGEKPLSLFGQEVTGKTASLSLGREFGRFKTVPTQMLSTGDFSTKLLGTRQGDMWKGIISQTTYHRATTGTLPKLKIQVETLANIYGTQAASANKKMADFFNILYTKGGAVAKVQQTAMKTLTLPQITATTKGLVAQTKLSTDITAGLYAAGTAGGLKLDTINITKQDTPTISVSAAALLKAETKTKLFPVVTASGLTRAQEKALTKQILIPVSMPAMKAAKRLEPITVAKLMPKMAMKLEPMTITTPKAITSPKLAPSMRLKLEPTTIMRFKTGLKLAPITAAQLRTTTKRAYADLAIVPPTSIPTWIPPPALRLPKIKIKRPKGDPLTKAFEVWAKREGKYFKLSRKPLPKMKALGLGAKWADISAGATFKLKPSQYKIKKPKGIDPTWARMKKMFYVGKGGTYIEKVAHRISTAGEKQEITFKGLKQLYDFPFLRKKKKKKRRR